MTCPVCNCGVKVTYSRDRDDHVFRYRTCQSCGYSFHTIEIDQDMFQRMTKTATEDLGGENDFRFGKQK